MPSRSERPSLPRPNVSSESGLQGRKDDFEFDGSQVRYIGGQKKRPRFRHAAPTLSQAIYERTSCPHRTRRFTAGGIIVPIFDCGF